MVLLRSTLCVRCSMARIGREKTRNAVRGGSRPIDPKFSTHTTLRPRLYSSVGPFSVFSNLYSIRFTQIAISKSLLHTTPRRSTPKLLLLLYGPVGRFVAALGGRLTRSWWTRLTPERRAAVRAWFRKNSRKFYAFFGVLGLGGVGFYATHLEETPMTGRRRFIMFSREEVLKMIESERKVILESFFKVDEHLLLKHDHPLYQRVHGIVSRILAGNNVQEFEGFNWGLYVIDNPGSVNALCLPTGDIFVFTGLIKQCKSDDELAFILSHEIAHAVMGHGVEALSRNGVVSFLQMCLIAVIWAVIPSDLLSYFMHGLSRSSVQVMFELPHSRKMETEADKVGLMIAARACYDPAQAAGVWAHLQNIDSGKDLEFLSTHPANETRLESLQILIPEAYGVWEKSECAEIRKEVTSFQDTIKKQLKKVFVW